MGNEAIGTVFVEFTLDGNKFKSELKNIEGIVVNTGNKIEKVIASQTSTAVDLLINKFKQFAIYAAAAFSVHKIMQFGEESILLAARIETLNVSLHQIGKNAGYTTSEVDKFVQGVKKQGITTSEATSSVIKLAQAQINLDNASKLARIAQDAAVVGNINSSEALGRMIHGIQTQQTEILRGIGINVRMDQAMQKYGTTLGKNAMQLNQAERAQAIVNAVFEEGTKLAGIYETSMLTAGKQMNSTKRYVDEIKESLGKAFTPALAIIVMAFNDNLKEMGKWLQLPGTKEKIFEIGLEIKNIASVVWSALNKIIDIITSVIKLMSLLENVIKGVAFAFTTYLISSLIVTATSFTTATAAGNGLIVTLKTISIWAVTNPLGIIATSIALIATGFFTITDHANKASSSMSLFQERLKTMSLDESITKSKELSDQFKEINKQLDNEKKNGPVLDVNKNYLKIDELEKQKTLTFDMLNLVNNRIKLMTKVNDLEEKAAKAQRELIENKMKDEELARNKMSYEASTSAASIQIAAKTAMEKTNIRKFEYDKNMMYAKNAYTTEVDLIQKEYLFIKTEAEKAREDSINQMNMEFVEKTRISKGKFNLEKETAAKMIEINNAKNEKMRQADLTLEKFNSSMIEKNKVAKQKLLDWDKKNIDELIEKERVGNTTREVVDSFFWEKKLEYEKLTGQKTLENDEEILDLMIDQYKDTYIGGIKDALFDLEKYQTSWGDVSYNVVKTFTQDAQKQLSDNLFFFLKGQWGSMKVDFQSIMDDMLRILTAKIAEMIVQWGIYQAAVAATSALGISMPAGITNPFAPANIVGAAGGAASLGNAAANLWGGGSTAANVATTGTTAVSVAPTAGAATGVPVSSTLAAYAPLAGVIGGFETSINLLSGGEMQGPISALADIISGKYSQSGFGSGATFTKSGKWGSLPQMLSNWTELPNSSAPASEALINSFMSSVGSSYSDIYTKTNALIATLPADKQAQIKAALSGINIDFFSPESGFVSNDLGDFSSVYLTTATAGSANYYASRNQVNLYNKISSILGGYFSQSQIDAAKLYDPATATTLGLSNLLSGSDLGNYVSIAQAVLAEQQKTALQSNASGFTMPTIPSLAIGADYIPRDNYFANLHEGEAILDKETASAFRAGKFSGSGTSEEITINVPVYLDGNKVAESVAKYIPRNGSLSRAIKEVRR